MNSSQNTSEHLTWDTMCAMHDAEERSGRRKSWAEMAEEADAEAKKVNDDFVVEQDSIRDNSKDDSHNQKSTHIKTHGKRHPNCTLDSDVDIKRRKVIASAYDDKSRSYCGNSTSKNSDNEINDDDDVDDDDENVGKRNVGVDTDDANDDFLGADDSGGIDVDFCYYKAAGVDGASDDLNENDDNDNVDVAGKCGCGSYDFGKVDNGGCDTYAAYNVNTYDDADYDDAVKNVGDCDISVNADNNDANISDNVDYCDRKGVNGAEYSDDNDVVYDDDVENVDAAANGNCDGDDAKTVDADYDVIYSEDGCSDRKGLKNDDYDREEGDEKEVYGGDDVGDDASSSDDDSDNADYYDADDKFDDLKKYKGNGDNIDNYNDNDGGSCRGGDDDLNDRCDGVADDCFDDSADGDDDTDYYDAVDKRIGLNNEEGEDDNIRNDDGRCNGDNDGNNRSDGRADDGDDDESDWDDDAHYYAADDKGIGLNNEKGDDDDKDIDDVIGASGNRGGDDRNNGSVVDADDCNADADVLVDVDDDNSDNGINSTITRHQRRYRQCKNKRYQLIKNHFTKKYVHRTNRNKANKFNKQNIETSDMNEKQKYVKDRTFRSRKATEDTTTERIQITSKIEGTKNDDFKSYVEVGGIASTSESNKAESLRYHNNNKKDYVKYKDRDWKIKQKKKTKQRRKTHIKRLKKHSTLIVTHKQIDMSRRDSTLKASIILVSGTGIAPVIEFKHIMIILSQLITANPPGPEITMRYEMLRLYSLRNYPKHNKPYVIRLAFAGFYYDENGDEVICYTCGMRYRNWVETDAPMHIHKRISPNCRFLTKNGEVNVPVQRPSGPEVNKFAFLDEPETSNGTTFEGLNMVQPKHPEYAIKSRRMNSLQGCNQYQTPESLADGGFYFTGVVDGVRCFSCGASLRSLAEKDNHWIEHARLSRHCAHLIQLKGEEFINLVHRAENENCEQTATSAGTGHVRAIELEEEEDLIPISIPLQQLERSYQTSTRSEKAHETGPCSYSLPSTPAFTSGRHTREITVTPLLYNPSSCLNATDLAQGATGTTTGSAIVHPKHQFYAEESCRVTSFQGWPNNLHQTPENLANAGFYFVGVGDGVRCYFCGIGLRQWAKDDCPWIEHARWSRHCAHLKQHKGEEFANRYHNAAKKSGEQAISRPGKGRGFVSHKLKEKELKEEKAAADSSNTLQQQELVNQTSDTSKTEYTRKEFATANTTSLREEIRTQRHIPNPFVALTAAVTGTLSGVNRVQPEHPDYAIRSSRISTFQEWPDNRHQTPESLADAGFYYAGFGDAVKCFCCGIGLRQWEDEDIPWIEHARWSGNCVYLKQCKGEEFINLVHRAEEMNGEQTDSTPDTGNQLPTDELERLLLTDAAQSVLEVGYQPRIIKKAIEIVVREHGRDGFNSERITEQVIEIEDAEDASNLSTNFRQQEIGNQTSDTTLYETAPEPSNNPLQSTEASASTSTQNEVTTLQHQTYTSAELGVVAVNNSSEQGATFTTAASHVGLNQQQQRIPRHVVAFDNFTLSEIDRYMTRYHWVRPIPEEHQLVPSGTAFTG